MIKKLEGRVALITGASGGLGSGIARELASMGCSLAIHYFRSSDKAKRLKNELSKAGVQAEVFQADLRVLNEAEILIEQVIDRFGKLDILINNAGFSKLVPPNDLDGLTEDLINDTSVMKINAPLYTMRAAANFLKLSTTGVIINITSAAGVASRGSTIVYAAVNAALYSLTKSFARILSPVVRVNAVAPGYLETGFVVPADGKMAEIVSKQNYIRRCATVDEVAKTVAFLITDGTSITGEEIVVDGGIARLWKQ